MLLPLRPVCRQHDTRKDGKSVVFIQYCYSATHRIQLNTGIAIPWEFWNTNKGCIKDHLPCELGDSRLLNIQIRKCIRIIEDLIEVAAKKKIDDNVTFIKTIFSPELNISDLSDGSFLEIQAAGAGKNQLNVYHEIDEYIKVRYNKVSPATITIILNMKSHLKAFEKYRKLPITFESFDFNFYDTYIDFLTFHYVQNRFSKNQVVGMKQNTIGKTIKHLKIFIRDRVRRKIIPPVDLSVYKVFDEEADAIYLKIDEIAKIYNTDLSPYPGLAADRNLFVVACLTGLRFSDFTTISKEDLRNGLLYKKQKKSDHWVVIPLQQEAKQILQDIFVNNAPISSNPSFNKNIKIIGKLAGINESITFTYKQGNKGIKVTKAKCEWVTSHTARRSFCTNEFLAGTPVKLIMQISGHKREKDFYRYIRITPEESAETIKKIWMERNNMQAFSEKRKD